MEAYTDAYMAVSEGSCGEDVEGGVFGDRPPFAVIHAHPLVAHAPLREPLARTRAATSQRVAGARQPNGARLAPRHGVVHPARRAHRRPNLVRAQPVPHLARPPFRRRLVRRLQYAARASYGRRGRPRARLRGCCGRDAARVACATSAVAPGVKRAAWRGRVTCSGDGCGARADRAR
ncbi:hypothetical protein FGB62_66g145 [Gracilaria domingensis]|nr:hypothetical protein FGB62_66g145 [Gracilaria domingensis]